MQAKAIEDAEHEHKGKQTHGGRESEEEERKVATDGIQADETSSFLITEENKNLFTLLTTIENG